MAFKLNISEKLCKKIKEDLLHILEWTMDSNKTVALEMISDIADELLKEMKEEEKENEPIVPSSWW